MTLLSLRLALLRHIAVDGASSSLLGASGSRPCSEGVPAASLSQPDRTATKPRPNRDYPRAGVGNDLQAARDHSALRPSIRPTRLRCRLPLLTASACRARAQLKLQPTKPLHGSDWAGCDGVDRRPRRELACAHRCSFSAAAFCSHRLGRANETMDSSATIDSRRQVLL